ncbi:hypothetical protein [Mesorhizobium sp. WSM2239]|uniref:Uncharacterized protein n=2 Tax=unclassified Mesorhizobium TaxID=325217 RepID=A0AAU8DD07_9HYPH
MKRGAEIVPLDDAIKSEIRGQIAIARTKFGPRDFTLLCIERTWGNTLDDRKALDMLRSLNRTGSIYKKDDLPSRLTSQYVPH